MNKFVTFNQDQLTCQGEWTLKHLPEVFNELKNVKWPSAGSLQVDGKAITKMDSAGALVLSEKIKQLSSLQIALKNFSEQHQKLFYLVEQQPVDEKNISFIKKFPWLEQLGKSAINQYQELQLFLSFIGQLTLEAFSIFKKS